MAYPRSVLKDTTSNVQTKRKSQPALTQPPSAKRLRAADAGVLSPPPNHNESGDESDGAAATVAWIQARKHALHHHGHHHHNHKRRKSVAVPDSDRVARQNCFDYLVSAIDEVWAQYCDCTSSAESQLYDETPRHMSFSHLESDLPSSPVSLCEEGEEEEEDAAIYSSGPETPGGQPTAQHGRSKSITVAAFDQPKSVRLLNLKKRLMNAKYFLSDLVESLDPVSSSEFWHRWDMIKYATIELVEEDGDDDETVEAVTEELEEGRYHR
ncbi:hypothetical protein TRICI_002824 [Trichomonascus ciferrii]|uniref:Uncharacterized protein n=1 Tax=Trichomonascus ciferrii TaxID=44093 RepID=A0A642V5M1_9ASCO|nr:hypothetical protein TRICI_002824 [Trichomonascus ciferrii]